MANSILFVPDFGGLLDVLGVVVPHPVGVVDLGGLVAAEIDVVVGFAQQFALDGRVELEPRQSQQVHVFLGGRYLILSHFVDVGVLQVVARPADLVVVHAVLVEGFDFGVVPVQPIPPLFGGTRCRFLPHPRLLFELLHALEIVIELQTSAGPDIPLGVTSFDF